MARIDLVDLAHSYGGDNAPEESFALKPISMTWRQGGAYALLGPSGCGKTTLLNLISGIVTPSRGKILFDGVDITPLSTQKRNIAQVFQFPVIYDTMTVEQNLAFPLKNRGVPKVDDRRAGRRDRRSARSDAVSFAQGDAAHRRRQTEDLARPRTGAIRCRGRAVRRAADGDRSRVEMAVEVEAEGAASHARPDHDLRHPRPDRGADLRRYGCRDA